MYLAIEYALIYRYSELTILMINSIQRLESLNFFEQVDSSIVSRDMSYLRQQAKQNIKKYIDERLPEEYEKCLVGLTSILKEAWNAASSTEDKREKIQALSLAKECYEMKLELLKSATVVDDAIRFVSDRANMKLKSFSSGSSNKSQKANGSRLRL